MNSPHPALLRAYGTDEVFFKKASGGRRVVDQVSEKVAGEFLKKIAAPRGPSLVSVGAHLGGSLAKMARANVVQMPARPMLKAPAVEPVQASVAALTGGKPALASPKPPIRKSLPPVPGASPVALAPPMNREQQAEAIKGRPLPEVKPPPRKPGSLAKPTDAPGLWDRTKAYLKPGWKTYAGLAGLGYLGYKAVGGAKDLAQAAVESGNPGYGYSPGGYYTPMGVNAYGQPQLGSPMMG